MRKAYIYFPLLGSLLMAGCDDETEPTPTLEVAVAGAVNVVQGQSGTTTITVTRGGGYDDEVDLTVGTLPTGVTATFDPATIPAGSGAGTSTLTLSAAADAAVGTAQFTVTADAVTATNLVATATGSVTVAEAPNFTLAVAPTTLSIAAGGGTGTSNVTLTRTGGFNTAVNLTVANLPAGVTAAFDNAAPTGNAAVLTLTADATAVPGTTTITVSGTGTPGTRTADIALTVTAAPAGGFTIALDPAAVTVAAGASATSTVTVSKTGTFTSNVTLSVIDLPAGITAAFNPAAASAGMTSTATRDVQTTSVLTLSVGPAVAAGAYPLAVRGAFEGQPNADATLTLTVPPPPGPGNTSFKFCDLDDLPVWFGRQDGSGAWTQVTGVVAGDGTTYSFDITQATGGVAWVTGDAADGFSTSVFYGTQAELIANGTAQCAETPDAGRTLNGSVAGVGATDQVNITMGGGSASALGALPTFQLTGVRNGPADLLATQSTIAVGPPIVVTPVKMIIRRGLDIANNGTIPVLDFSQAEAFNPQTAVITFTNLGTDTPVAFVGYQTPTTEGTLYVSFGGAGATQTVYGVPAAQQQASDLHNLIVFANSATAGDARGHFAWFKTLVDMPVALGPVLNAPTVTSLGTAPYPRYQSTAAIQAEYDDSFVFTLTQGGASSRGWTVSASKGYFGAGASYTLAVPDLTPAGFLATWALQTGTEVQLSTGAFGFSSGTTLPNVEGGTASFATRGGQVTP